ncbi:bifunctional riboflavin kinase/FAD synthetase [Verrucomicrobiota bacterium]
MRILRDIRLMKKEKKPVVLAIGFFDGLHRGHRKVIQKALGEAKNIGGETWVLTFDVHPMKVLKPDSAPALLTSGLHKLKLLNLLSVDGCLHLPFTRKFSDIKPEAFISMLPAMIPTLSGIVVGENWRFGRQGKGDTDLLFKLTKGMNIKVDLVSPVLRRKKSVSSTRIRKAVRHGDFEEAHVMLGRPFSIIGTVTKGRTIGRKLGFPTANLDPHNETLPPDAVYAVRAVVNGKVYDGVVNLGVRPTFYKEKHSRTSPELHLLDFNGTLYGEDIEVFFVKKLRNERRFLHAERLKEQISRDIQKARLILARKKLKESLYIPTNAVI